MKIKDTLNYEFMRLFSNTSASDFDEFWNFGYTTEANFIDDCGEVPIFFG